MTDFLTGPGFLGTKATLRSDLTLVLIVITALLFNIGYILARRKLFTLHHWVQSGTVVLNSLVVVVSMVSSYIIHILPGIPNKLGQGDYAVTTAHAIIGASAFLMGIYIVLGTLDIAPRRWRITNYRKVMRWGYGLYMLATLFGIVLYLIVFVLGV